MRNISRPQKSFTHICLKRSENGEARWTDEEKTTKRVEGNFHLCHSLYRSIKYIKPFIKYHRKLPFYLLVRKTSESHNVATVFKPNTSFKSKSNMSANQSDKCLFQKGFKGSPSVVRKTYSADIFSLSKLQRPPPSPKLYDRN